MNHMPEDFSELESRLTDTARASLERAGMIAQDTGSPYVGTEHVLLGVLAQNASLGAKILAESGVTLDRAESVLDLTPDAIKIVVIDRGVSRDVMQMIRTAWQLAMEFGQDHIGTEHLVYSMLTQRDARATRLLRDMNVDLQMIRDGLEEVFDRQRQESESESGTEAQKRSRELGVLEKYGIDLTAKAQHDELDPVIGRDKETQRMVTILGRRTKNNPALIGEPGVGKTAVVEGLAQRIVKGAVPGFLLGKRIVQLDLTAMVAGTKYRGQFEERLQKVLTAVKKHQEIILFIDELHLLVGAGSAEGSMDAANVLKPALARGEVRVIGATTFEEYRKHIEKDAALGRRFQTVTVNEPDVDMAARMVQGLASRLAEHHRVQLDSEAVQMAVELAERYIPERQLPDKAIDVIDEAAALLRSETSAEKTAKQRLEEQIRKLAAKIDLAVESEDYERAAQHKVRMMQLEQRAKDFSEEESEQSRPVVDETALRRAVSAITNVPLERLDRHQAKALTKLEARLGKQVLGQTEAIHALARTIKRARSGLSGGRRPLGTFVFLGPTGVGKTELARVLANEVFGGERSLIKIDMSEFGEKHMAARLVGAPAGYVGYEDGGKLTDRVRRQPYSVVLFDEIEKAHPDVLNMLLQILEDGQLTDSSGRTVSFRQTIIILTSNLGAEKMTQEVELGFRSARETSQRIESLHERNAQAAKGELENLMRPELINRFDAIVTFHALTRPVVGKIFDNLVAELATAVAAQERKLVVTPAAKRRLINEGFSEQYGARPLRRVIEQQVGDAIADVLIDGSSKQGDTLEIAVQRGEVVVNVKTP